MILYLKVLIYFLIVFISLKRGKSYIKSPEWLVNKRATINPKNKDNKCFQYSITVALNHQNIENHPERISNIKPFIEKTDFPAGIKDWKKFNKIIRQLLVISYQYHTIQKQISHTNQNITESAEIK